ncbi:MAG: PEFG-CTERM sorting domain-containing protein [Nitrosopumilus sp.]|nr:PEFG-CTERM sorting domain-containing protein [Nitrosopumilus sp.]MDH3385003.1 PEFG-CTERM sorting domain-containing protein [Nitrosopumilus sp.]
MKIQTKLVFPIMIVFATIIFIPPAFADANVSAPQGTSVPGCETTNECYIPFEVTVNVGDTVTWSNDDTAAHTVTAGSATDGPSGAFDSSLFMAATTFSHTFEEEGEFPYFCMVHPWMQGMVIVQTASAQPMPKAPLGLDQIMAQFQTSEGMAGSPMTIDLTMTDLDGVGIEHITYNIKATQGSDVLLDEEGHMHMGTVTNIHTTEVLPADASESMPVDITIESVGFGHDEQYVAVSGEIATKQVVPEFGTIAAMILAVAIISIIAISAKSRLSIMPRI